MRKFTQGRNKDRFNEMIDNITVLKSAPHRSKAKPWMGMSGTGIRKAYAKDDAGVDSQIVCYLDTDSTGEEITVHCEVAGSNGLNEAIPRLEDGDMITVFDDNGTWRSIMTFQSTGDCT